MGSPLRPVVCSASSVSSGQSANHPASPHEAGTDHSIGRKGHPSAANTHKTEHLQNQSPCATCKNWKRDSLDFRLLSAWRLVLGILPARDPLAIYRSLSDLRFGVWDFHRCLMFDVSLEPPLATALANAFGVYRSWILIFGASPLRGICEILQSMVKIFHACPGLP